ncbi:microtubule associated protein-domain-containing protein [Entophlyctis helioformis]|nr:microtubule associated protein-domain-containing protein [Entophlyctis helioformis]
MAADTDNSASTRAQQCQQTEAAGADPAPTHTSCSALPPLAAVDKIRRLLHTLHVCAELVEQDSADARYELDGAWTDTLSQLEGLVHRVVSAPLEHRERLLAQMHSLQEQVDAMRAELGEDADQRHVSGKHQTPIEAIGMLTDAMSELERLRADRRAEMDAMAADYARIAAMMPDWTWSLPAPVALTLADVADRRNALAAVHIAKDARQERIDTAKSLLQSSLSQLPDKHIPSNVRDFMAAIQSDTDQTFPPLSLDLCSALDDAVRQVAVVTESLMARLSAVTSEIVAFWEELQTAPETRVSIETDLARLDEYEEICESLREEWMAKMKHRIDTLLESVQQLWTKCHVNEPYQTRFMASLNDTHLYSPITAVRLEQEEGSLQTRFNRYQSIYKLIDDRKMLLQRMKDFETTASDPKRLFRPSFQLLDEEKFRKTCLPTLKKTEMLLRDAVTAYENDTEQEFELNGERYLDTLDNEIANRFINESMFVLSRPSSSHAHASHPSHPHHHSTAAATAAPAAEGTQRLAAPRSPRLPRSPSSSSLSHHAAVPPSPNVRQPSSMRRASSITDLGRIVSHTRPTPHKRLNG